MLSPSCRPTGSWQPSTGGWHRCRPRVPRRSCTARWTALRSSPPPRASDRPTLPRQGIVDRIVPERPDAAEEPREFLARLSSALEYELTSLIHRDKSERLAARYLRYRNLGLHPEQ